MSEPTKEQIEMLRNWSDPSECPGTLWTAIRAILTAYERQRAALRKEQEAHRRTAKQFVDEHSLAGFLEKEVERLRAELARLEAEKVDGEFVCINAERAEQAEARLAEVVDDVKHEADMLESFGASRSPQVQSFLRTTIERLRALAAARPEEKP